jgi:hypothetical protein
MVRVLKQKWYSVFQSTISYESDSDQRLLFGKGVINLAEDVTDDWAEDQ